MYNKNNPKNPIIPLAAGIGGEVVLACSECTRLLNKFMLICVDQEANGQSPTTFRGFCEAYRNGNKEPKINTELCLIMNQKLAMITNESGSELVDPTKGPALCVKFKNECDKLGGGPNCFSGFCENVLECIDCPTALVDKYHKGGYNDKA